MSLFYQHTINQTTKLGIWKIEEPENFFLLKVPLQQNITHPHKRLQHLAGRYLLQYLFPDFPYAEILIADTRKPYLQNEQYHFSISHCGNYAAALVSSTHRVGIDIEIPTLKVERIAHKFIHSTELKFLQDYSSKNLKFKPQNNAQPVVINHQLLTILWSAKEAIFKWYSSGGIDFKQHIQLNNIIKKQSGNFVLPFTLQKESKVQLNIISKTFNTLVLSWLAD